MNHLKIFILIGVIASHGVLFVHTQQIPSAKPSLIESKVEELPVVTSKAKQTSNPDDVETTRSNILDNIFNIPIQTLRAVSELVQSIAGNLQSAGSGTYSSRRNERLIKPEKKELNNEETEN